MHDMQFALYDDWGYPVTEEQKYIPQFRERCGTCGRQMVCNGCSGCGSCEKLKA